MEEKALDLLIQLANKLGTTTEKMWDVLVAQAHVEGILAMIYIIISLGMIITTVFLHLKYSKGQEDGCSAYVDNDIVVFVMVIMMVASLCSIAVIVVSIEVISTAYLNPDYFALKMIMKML